MKSVDRSRIIRRLALPAVVAILTLLQASCSKAPTLGPQGSNGVAAATSSASTAAGFGSATFYPLSVGNSWEYSGRVALSYVGGSGPYGEPGIEIEYRESHRILGTQQLSGLTYFVREEMREERTEPPGEPYTAWTYVRQDRDGFFAADVYGPPTLDGARALVAPAPERPLDFSSLRSHGFSEEAIARFGARISELRAAVRGRHAERYADSKASSGELTWLLYPLRIGTEWNIRPDFLWPAWVSRVETLPTEAGPLVAYRIDTEPFGIPLLDGEYVRLYYGRAGYLGYSIHSSAEATDGNGEPTGVIAIFDDDMRLTEATQVP
jgi:hypothetical protein